MKRRFSLLMGILILLSLWGCSPKYSFLVEGRTSQEYEYTKSPNDTYKIIFDYEKNKNDFDYEIAYNSVLEVFNKNGYKTVEYINDANYVVFVNYNVRDYTYTVNHSVPITGQVGVNTHTGYTYGPYGMQSYTYTTPRYGTVGYNYYQTTETSYTHSLSVIAYSFSLVDFQINKKIWQLVSVTSSKSNNFRDSIPGLLFTLEKYMATDTHGDLDIDIYEKQGKLITEEDLIKTRENTSE